MSKPKLIRAFSEDSLESPPVWLMRQAGRYLPEYRALKEKHTFLELCKSAELATEVTLQPLRRFNLDAAIVFADILLPAEAIGFSVDFNPGPKIANPIKDPSDLQRLHQSSFNPAADPTCKTISALRKHFDADSAMADKAVIGFCGSPWTLACYLTDQGPFKHFAATQIFAAKQSKAFVAFIDLLEQCLGDFLLAQIAAGADAVQIFDSWGGLLAAEDYRRFSLPSIQRIVERIKPTGCPVIVYCGGTAHLLNEMKETEADGISLDWKTELSVAEEILGSSMLIQGNLDPAHLFLPQEQLEIEAKLMSQQLKRRNRYIANLGHGILQQTPIESVETFIHAVKSGWQQ